MEKKRSAALVSVIAMIAAAASNMNVYALSDDVNKADTAASVSGYVSTEGGDFLLASQDKTPMVYFDDAEEVSVRRAAGDLCSDIKAVTGVTPHVIGTVPVIDTATGAALPITERSAEPKTLPNNAYISDDKLIIDGFEQLKECGRGVIAVYDPDGTLDRVFFSNELADSENGELTFEGLPALEGHNVKGFVWKINENGDLTNVPLTTAAVMRDMPTAEPTSIPTLKPTDPPTPLPTSESGDWENADVIIGTVGKSAAIDELAEKGVINVENIRGKWESFTIHIVDDKLVIAGSDERGTIYGMYDVSEKIGVSPWYWWADVPIGHADSLYVTLGKPYTEGEPSVKFRGIFFNDEESMAAWAESKGDKGYTELYTRTYELLLRLKANYLWPAMHSCSEAFHAHDVNPANADNYGIVMGASHCELLTRNNNTEFDLYVEEWKSRPENQGKALYRDNTAHEYVYTEIDNDGNKVYNIELMLDYWRDALEKYGVYDNIYNIGLRGLHDEGTLIDRKKIDENAPENLARAKEVIEEVIDKQRVLIEETLGKPAANTGES